MPEIAKLGDALKGALAKDWKVKLVVLMGIVGMALIFFSQFSSGSSKKDLPADTTTATFTSDQYAANLEEKLSELISQIDGVGRAQVMVTLESGVEYIYAQEEKRNVDRSQEGGATEVSGRVTEKENVEQTYLLVENESGKKQPLVTTQLQPSVQGVVIVCEGGDDIRVEQNLINVVTTALKIPSTRVCVVKISDEESN